MKFLNCAIFICLGLSVSLVEGFDGDLEKIETSSGKLYEKIFILSGDETGLTFRHDAGIAKVDYSELPMNLRMLFEPAGEDEGPETAVPEAEEFVPMLDFTLRYRFSPAVYANPIGHSCRGVHWKSHWPRYHPAHRLVDPVCRELALRDFLYTTGLLPAPFGVHPVRLPPNYGQVCLGW